LWISLTGMTSPRPSRNARWAIGFSLVAVFGLVAVGAMVVALVQLTSGLSPGDLSGRPDATAEATILDVDVYNLDDDVEPRDFDRQDGDAGYADVDIQFANNGGSADPERTSVSWMSWPDDLELPQVGDKVMIEYYSDDPEYDPELAGSADGRPEVGLIGTGPVAAGSSDPQDRPGTVSAPVRWTLGISGTLTLVSLIFTVIWARRAEPADRSQPRPGSWQQPGWQLPPPLPQPHPTSPPPQPYPPQYRQYPPGPPARPGQSVPSAQPGQPVPSAQPGPATQADRPVLPAQPSDGGLVPPD
jgi:hypothetical protein